jgi:hypothetical protein
VWSSTKRASVAPTATTTTPIIISIVFSAAFYVLLNANDGRIRRKFQKMFNVRLLESRETANTSGSNMFRRLLWLSMTFVLESYHRMTYGWRASSCLGAVCTWCIISSKKYVVRSIRLQSQRRLAEVYEFIHVVHNFVEKICRKKHTLTIAKAAGGSL